MENQLKSTFKELESMENIEDVLYKDNKTLVLTGNRFYPKEFLQTVCNKIAEFSDNTIGLETRDGGDELDNKKVLVFHNDTDDRRFMFCMYGAVCGIDPVILTDIYDQIDRDEKLETVADMILDISPNNPMFNGRDDLLSYMNIDLGNQSEKDLESKSAFEW